MLKQMIRKLASNGYRKLYGELMSRGYFRDLWYPHVKLKLQANFQISVPYP
jgi:hypothetical protein